MIADLRFLGGKVGLMTSWSMTQGKWTNGSFASPIRHFCDTIATPLPRGEVVWSLLPHMMCRGMKIGRTGGWLVAYVYVIATIVISLPVFPIVSLIIGKRRIGQNIHKSCPPDIWTWPHVRKVSQVRGKNEHRNQWRCERELWSIIGKIS